MIITVAAPHNDAKRYAWLTRSYMSAGLGADLRREVGQWYRANGGLGMDDDLLLYDAFVRFGAPFVGEDPDPSRVPGALVPMDGAAEYEEAMMGMELLGGLGGG